MPFSSFRLLGFSISRLVTPFGPANFAPRALTSNHRSLPHVLTIPGCYTGLVGHVMPALRRLLLASGLQQALPPAAVLATAFALGLALAIPAFGQIRPPDGNEQSTPAQLRYDALRAYRDGRYTEALSLAVALAADPDVLMLRGRALAALGRYDEAAAAFQPGAGRDPSGEAAFELGRLHLLRGRSIEATRVLEPVIAAGARSDVGETIGRAARAAQLLSRFEQANSLFRDAAALIGDDPPLQVAWGELFLEKQNRPEAVRSFRAALQGDRRNAAAYAGLARAFADENAAVAKELAERALGVNPSFVPAHLVVADLALDEDRRADAMEAVKQALSVNPQSLEALSLQAAIAFLDDRAADFEDTVQRVLAINPKYGEVYRVAGAQAARHYRFSDAVVLTRKALALDPQNARASADLGTHLLRTGDEQAARAALDRAFKADPYDVVAYNLLGLLDSLESFTTVQDGILTFRLHPEEAPVLKEHALPLARDALRRLSERYRFTPTGPILIEIFPRHDDFAVRNVGLPGMIGALGACFGRVVTLDSPRARPPGTFNWQATLYHELAHVVTLQMSANRIPRWLTEGISVYEEQQARPEWGRDMDLEFAEALERGTVIGLPELNAGFMDPTTISMAYYEASLLVEYLVGAHGHPALEALVRSFADGVDTDAAMKKTMGTSLEEVQPLFTEWLNKRFEPIIATRRAPDDVVITSRTPRETIEQVARDHPGYFDVHLRLGELRAQAGDTAGAFAAWTHAAELLPAATGEDSPRARIARLAIEKGDSARAVAALEGTLQREGANVEAARQLAGLLDGAQQPALAAQAWARVAELDPFDANAAAVLGRRALHASDAEQAARWFRAALAAGPADRAAAYCDLAESYLGIGQPALAKRQVLAALENAPMYARAQDLLLAIVDGSR
jgi:tetratricopeptide (TPR) repeat protein